MRKFLFVLFTMFICTIAFAQTIRWHVGDTIIQTDTCSSGDSITPPTAPAKTGYNFIGWVGYTPIEYLESTGTQYIDTGYYPNQDTGIKTKIKILSTENSVFFGNNKEDGGAFESFIWNNGGSLYFTYVTSDIIDRGLSINDVLEYDWNKNVISYYKNGVRQTNISFSVKSFSATKTFFLFAERSSDRHAYPAYIKMYYFQIYDNNTIVRDMIPVLDPAGTPCMYDKVTRQFFYNQGTGDFIAGPIIQ